MKKLAVAAAVVLIALGYAKSRFEKRTPTKDEIAAEKVGRLIATGSMPVETAAASGPDEPSGPSGPLLAAEAAPEPEKAATTADVAPVKERVTKLIEQWHDASPDAIDQAAALWFGGAASMKATAGFNRWRSEKHLFVVDSFDVGDAAFHPKASGGGYVTVDVTINKLPYRIGANGSGPLFWAY